MNTLFLDYKRETGLSSVLSWQQLEELEPAKINNAKEAIADYTTNLQNEFHTECGYFNIPSPAYVRWLENKLKELQK